MTPTLDALVRERIRTYLRDLPSRPTQQAIGDAIGRTQTWVSQYLSGRHDIDLDTLAKLAAFMHMDLGSLLHDHGSPRLTLAPDFAEALTLLQSLTPEERATVLDVLRVLARRPATKRARR